MSLLLFIHKVSRLQFETGLLVFQNNNNYNNNFKISLNKCEKMARLKHYGFYLLSPENKISSFQEAPIIS